MVKRLFSEMWPGYRERRKSVASGASHSSPPLILPGPEEAEKEQFPRKQRIVRRGSPTGNRSYMTHSIRIQAIYLGVRGINAPVSLLPDCQISCW